jgi:hypothetical protein
MQINLDDDEVELLLTMLKINLIVLHQTVAECHDREELIVHKQRIASLQVIQTKIGKGMH